MHGSQLPGTPEDTPRILVFGEVLFDIFPDGNKVAGGAPYNVARHLAVMGLDPLFVSRVGDDAPGAAILKEMDTLGMDVSATGVDKDHPTGTVEVRMQEGEPAYDIITDVAWDHIQAPEDHGCDLLYNGSLAARSMVSATSLAGLSTMESFVDLNLRKPWYSTPQVLDLVNQARTLKVNRAELAELCAMLSLPSGPLNETARLFIDETGIRTLHVTDGANGSLVASCKGYLFHVPAVKREGIVDTVGAGDAFSAVCLAGTVLGWSMPVTMTRASILASAICGIRGAFPAENDFHAPMLEQWRTPACR